MKSRFLNKRKLLYSPIRILAIVAYILLGGCAGLGNSKHENLAPNVVFKGKSLPDDTHVKNEEYRIGPEDVLKIDFFKAKALSREVRVTADGSITLPLIGTLKVAGLTPHELEDELVRLYGQRYLQDPQVTVTNTKEFITQRVTVEGIVKRPGVFPLKGNMTLLQAVALAEGIDENGSLANLQQVHLYRSLQGGKKDLYVFNLEDIRNGTTEDPLIRGEDIVVVPKNRITAAFKKIGDVIRNVVYFSLGASVPIVR